MIDGQARMTKVLRKEKRRAVRRNKESEANNQMRLIDCVINSFADGVIGTGYDQDVMVEQDEHYRRVNDIKVACGYFKDNERDWDNE